MTIAQETGKTIRYYRKIKGMTLEEMALAIGKTKSAASKYETGSVAIDVDTLYQIAKALDVRVSQLLYEDPALMNRKSESPVPAFFQDLHHFYMYYYDGRSKKISQTVGSISSLNEDGSYNLRLYMNYKNIEHYHDCENTYSGRMLHYDSLTVAILINEAMPMEHYQISVPSPFMNGPQKWGLAYGISSRPLMPTSTKVLLCKRPHEFNENFEKELKISKEDIQRLKMYNMLSIF